MPMPILMSEHQRKYRKNSSQNSLGPSIPQDDQKAKNSIKKKRERRQSKEAKISPRYSNKDRNIGVPRQTSIFLFFIIKNSFKKTSFSLFLIYISDIFIKVALRRWMVTLKNRITRGKVYQLKFRLMICIWIRMHSNSRKFTILILW